MYMQRSELNLNSAPTAISEPKRCVNLVAMQLLTTFSISARLLMSMGKDIPSMILIASS